MDLSHSDPLGVRCSDTQRRSLRGYNPEQLIAAAHAACFSMALSNILAQAGHPADSVRTDATVTLRLVDGAPTITKIALATVGRVPGRP
ncbi:MAG TPA: OsmC family protein [Pseudonocardiaceae bacterium]